MATPAQIEANRKNAQKSTGPRSEAGKLTCSQNAFKSGVYSEAPLVTGENPAELDALALAYHRSWRPANPAEEALLATLVYTEWLLRRMRRVETQLWNRSTDALHDSLFYKGDPAYELAATYGRIEDQLDRVQRRLSSLERIYHRTLHDLKRLQAGRSQPAPDPEPASAQPHESAETSHPIGFVPSISVPEPQTVPEPPSPAPLPEPLAPVAVPVLGRAIIGNDAGGGRQPYGAL